MLTLLFFLVLVIIIAGVLRTWKMQGSPVQQEFLQGTVPSELPSGLFKGSVRGYSGSWKGKEFDALEKSGINVFEKNGGEQRKYPFQIYRAKGLQDAKKDVLRIDYDRSGNPFWVRMVLDEIVQIDQEKYLGKVHVRLIPGLPFTVGFFRLEKDHASPSYGFAL